MPKKKSHITVTDQFCGAGGSSSGVHLAAAEFGGGVEVKLALNHWKLAIETHATNFPDTDHDCTDVSACDPRRYPSTDILITSPECTNHSLAKGKKIVKKQLDLYEKLILDPAAERSRATMWDVPRFAEYHDYNLIFVENVVDLRKWIMFDAWILAMRSLGYEHKCVYLNSMHCHPTPQSRDRMYVVFWKKGNKAPDLSFKPLAHCHKCAKDVHSLQSFKRDQKSFRYRTGYIYTCPHCTSMVEPYYYAAFNCIDWSDIGTKISDRNRTLSPITRERIQYGIDKYHGEMFPLIINDQHSTGIDHRVKDMFDRLPTITTEPHFKMVVPPFIIKEEHKNSFSNVRGVTESLQTQTTRQSMGLIMPWIIEMNRTGEAKPSKNPLSTITAGGINHAMLQVPFLVNNKGKSKTTRITAASNSQTTKSHLGLVTNDAWNGSIASYYGNSFCTKHLSEESGTVTAGERHALVSYDKPNVDDCYYRMLKAHEVKLAMAFDKNYIILGSQKNQVKQCGNAVTPPAMKFLIERGLKSLS